MGGTFRLGPTFAHSAYTAMVRQSNGSILLEGNTELVEKSRYGKFVEPGGVVQRRLPDGALDPGFHEVLEDERIAGLAQQADGDVLYAGAGEFQSQVHRLDANGIPDPSYGKGGVSVSVPLGARFLAVDDQGRTIVAGDAGVGGNCHDCRPTPVAAVARLLPDGSLDKSFGKEGMLLLPLPDSEGPVTGLVIEPDGSIVLGGETAIFGVTPAGQSSPTFDDGGTVAIDGSVGAITQASSGDLIVAAATARFCCGDRGSVVLRAFLADGRPDSAWASGGVARIAVADVDVPTALAPTPEGGVMLAGESAVANEPKGCSGCHYTPFVVRLTASGTVDPGFATQLTEPPGVLREVGATQGYTSRVAAIAVAPTGQMLLAGKGKRSNRQRSWRSRRVAPQTRPLVSGALPPTGSRCRAKPMRMASRLARVETWWSPIGPMPPLTRRSQGSPAGPATALHWRDTAGKPRSVALFRRT